MVRLESSFWNILLALANSIKYLLLLIFLFPSLLSLYSGPQVCILACRKIYYIHSWCKCLLNTLTDRLQASFTDSFDKHKKILGYFTGIGLLLFLITTLFKTLPGTELTTYKSGSAHFLTWSFFVFSSGTVEVLQFFYTESYWSWLA